MSSLPQRRSAQLTPIAQLVPERAVNPANAGLALHLIQLERQSPKSERAYHGRINYHLLADSVMRYPLEIRCGANVLQLEGGSDEAAGLVQRYLDKHPVGRLIINVDSDEDRNTAGTTQPPTASTGCRTPQPSMSQSVRYVVGSAANSQVVAESTTAANTSNDAGQSPISAAGTPVAQPAAVAASVAQVIAFLETSAGLGAEQLRSLCNERKIPVTAETSMRDMIAKLAANCVRRKESIADLSNATNRILQRDAVLETLPKKAPRHEAPQPVPLPHMHQSRHIPSPMVSPLMTSPNDSQLSMGLHVSHGVLHQEQLERHRSKSVLVGHCDRVTLGSIPVPRAGTHGSAMTRAPSRVPVTSVNVRVIIDQREREGGMGSAAMRRAFDTISAATNGNCEMATLPTGDYGFSMTVTLGNQRVVRDLMIPVLAERKAGTDLVASIIKSNRYREQKNTMRRAAAAYEAAVKQKLEMMTAQRIAEGRDPPQVDIDLHAFTLLYFVEDASTNRSRSRFAVHGAHSADIEAKQIRTAITTTTAVSGIRVFETPSIEATYAQLVQFAAVVQHAWATRASADDVALMMTVGEFSDNVNRMSAEMKRRYLFPQMLLHADKVTEDLAILIADRFGSFSELRAEWLLKERQERRACPYFVFEEVKTFLEQRSAERASRTAGGAVDEDDANGGEGDDDGDEEPARGAGAGGGPEVATTTGAQKSLAAKNAVKWTAASRTLHTLLMANVYN